MKYVTPDVGWVVLGLASQGCVDGAIAALYHASSMKKTTNYELQTLIVKIICTQKFV